LRIVNGASKNVDVCGFLRIVNGASKNVDGAVRSINGAFKNASAELSGMLTFIVKHCHLVICRF
jgi:hypothetical protein